MTDFTTEMMSTAIERYRPIPHRIENLLIDTERFLKWQQNQQTLQATQTPTSLVLQYLRDNLTDDTL